MLRPYPSPHPWAVTARAHGPQVIRSGFTGAVMRWRGSAVLVPEKKDTSELHFHDKIDTFYSSHFCHKIMTEEL